MLRGWVELFDRFIESTAQNYEDRDTCVLEIARHACLMVILLLVVTIIICFQAVMTSFDYSNLKGDYTELSLAYLRRSDVFDQVNDRLGKLEDASSGLYSDNERLQGKVDTLFGDNVKLNRMLFMCENPDWKPPGPKH